MQSRSRLLLQNIPSMRVQRLAANFSAVRAMSYDASGNEGRPRHSNDSHQPRRPNNNNRDTGHSNNTRGTRFASESRDSRFSNNSRDSRSSNNPRDSRHFNGPQGSRDSRPQRPDNGRTSEGRVLGPWGTLIRETSGPNCGLSYSEKQARWNELLPETGEPTRDVEIRHVPPFVTIDSIQSIFPAVETTHYRNHSDGTFTTRFSSVEEAENAVNEINNAVEFPFAIPQGSKHRATVDTQAPIRAKYIDTRVTDPQTTSIHITYFQGTEKALGEKLEPYVPAGHTLQFRYGRQGHVWVDLGSQDAVKAACEGLQGASHTCEIPVLAVAGAPSKRDSSTPKQDE